MHQVTTANFVLIMHNVSTSSLKTEETKHKIHCSI